MTLAIQSEDDEDPLDAIGRTAGRRVGVPIAPERQDYQHKPNAACPAPIVTPRRLKSFDSLSLSSVVIVNPLSTGGKLRPSHRPTLKEPGDRGPDIGQSGGSRSAPMSYTDHDREQLALRILGAVLAEHKTVLKDFTRLKSVGADIGDGLRRYFEVKAYSGEMPDIVSIEVSQIMRAQRSGKDFYLAVVAGLEEGYRTVIKLFARPLETLDWTSGTSFKLAGVKSKRALELCIDAVDSSTSTPNDTPEAAAVDPKAHLARRKGAGVAAMITHDMARRLATLGYTQEQIRKMKPQEAWNHLNSGSV